MDEAEGRAWMRDQLRVSRETEARLDDLVSLVIEEGEKQNLYSKATVPHFLVRHVVDSAQLIALAGPFDGTWIDLGSGAGFPGVVTAMITGRPTILVESRRKRSEFLDRVCRALGVDNARIHAGNVETLAVHPASVISARAFAPLDRLLSISSHLSDAKTRWVLPKGRSASEELAKATRTWHGEFTMKSSVTDPDSAVIVATGVRQRRSRER